MKELKKYNKEIFIPNNVIIEKKKNNLIISGPLGSTLLNLKKIDASGSGAVNFINFSDKFAQNTNLPNTQQKNVLILSSHCKSFSSCFFSIIQNKIIGVSSGFLISIRIIGVGYRVEIVENKKNKIYNGNQILYFKIGFSHDFAYMIPSSIRVFLLEQNLICIYGIDKNQVTQIAAKIREIKPPSVYKGKGIRLSDENVFTKPGKRK